MVKAKNLLYLLILILGACVSPSKGIEIPQKTILLPGPSWGNYGEGHYITHVPEALLLSVDEGYQRVLENRELILHYKDKQLTAMTDHNGIARWEEVVFTKGDNLLVIETRDGNNSLKLVLKDTLLLHVSDLIPAFLPQGVQITNHKETDGVLEIRLIGLETNQVKGADGSLQLWTGRGKFSLSFLNAAGEIIFVAEQVSGLFRHSSEDGVIQLLEDRAAQWGAQQLDNYINNKE